VQFSRPVPVAFEKQTIKSLEMIRVSTTYILCFQSARWIQSKCPLVSSWPRLNHNSNKILPAVPNHHSTASPPSFHHMFHGVSLHPTPPVSAVDMILPEFDVSISGALTWFSLSGGLNIGNRFYLAIKSSSTSIPTIFLLSLPRQT